MQMRRTGCAKAVHVQCKTSLALQTLRKCTAKGVVRCAKAKHAPREHCKCCANATRKLCMHCKACMHVHRQCKGCAMAAKAKSQGQPLAEHGICCRFGRPFDAFEYSPKGTPLCRCRCGGAGEDRDGIVECAKIIYWHRLEPLRGAWRTYCGALSPPGNPIFSPPGSGFSWIFAVLGSTWGKGLHTHTRTHGP